MATIAFSQSKNSDGACEQWLADVAMRACRKATVAFPEFGVDRFDELIVAVYQTVSRTAKYQADVITNERYVWGVAKRQARREILRALKSRRQIFDPKNRNGNISPVTFAYIDDQELNDARLNRQVDPAERIVHKEACEQLRAWVASHDDDDDRVLLQFLMNDYTLTQIAVRLKVTPSTVMRRRDRLFASGQHDLAAFRP